MEWIACHICGQDHAVPVFTVTDTNYGTPGTFTLVRCGACGLVYLNPRPTAQEMPARYLGDRYDPFAALKPGAAARPNAMQTMRAAALSQLIGRRGAVLDVGCADGRFLVAMRDFGRAVGGIDCAGVEPNPAAAAFARDALGLNVITGEVFAWPVDAQVDLITLWDVLEHTHSPVEVLQRVHQLLRRPGWLALSVPNWDSLERRLFRGRWIAIDAPRHLYHFSAETLMHLLNKTGFTVLELKLTAPVLSLASNCLRLGGDFLFRRGQARAQASAGAPGHPPPPGRMRRASIQIVHALLTPPNSVINRLQLGSSLTVIAQAQ